ncbi:MAG: hypothetical protein MI810_06975 [Flavobacteriales bacterium]|nr:hypothetical protein [Flavobacteriales bacterium]
MKSHLYFVCPTDQLETVINASFKHKNYFFTSLGDSVEFDIIVMEQLNDLLLTRNIQEISFVLSDDNRIVVDALKSRGFGGLKWLDDFYNQIVGHKNNSKTLWQTQDDQDLILSYYLKNKVEELRTGLNNLFVNQLEINGKIYKHKENVFKDIYSGLVCLEPFNLN